MILFVWKMGKVEMLSVWWVVVVLWEGGELLCSYGFRWRRGLKRQYR